MAAFQQLQKSALQPVNFEHVPDTLISHPHWVMWRLKSKENGTPTKPPFQIDGKFAKVDDWSTHATFEQVNDAYQTGKFDGIGLVLTNGICGIDLDHVVSADGKMEPWAEEIADQFAGTYIEMSPSGDGMHILARGTLPSCGKAGPDNRLEFYDQESPRYFTFTGQLRSGVNEITEQQDAIDWLCAKYADDRSAKPREAKAVPLSPNHAQDLTDDEIIARVKRAGNGVKFTKLYGGCSEGYPSQSEADLALANMLAYWTQDAMQIDRLFRASGLFRPKWEEPHSSDGTTYGTETIKTALAGSSAQKGAEASAAKQERPTAASNNHQDGFQFISAADLLANPQPIPWLISGIFEQSSFCHLFGASGSGKSFVAIDFACCIATGSDWHGHKVKQGAVFYIAGEGRAGIGRRLKAWEMHNTSVSGKPFFASRTSAALMDAENARNIAVAVQQLVAEHGVPQLIVVDTLARNLGNGDENSNPDISKFIHNLDVHLRDRFNAAVLVVHHTGHGDKDRARGASSLRAAMDHEYRLDDRDGYRSLVCTKAKESEPPEPIKFLLQQVVIDELQSENGKPMTSAVMVRVDVATKGNKATQLTKSSRLALKSLKEAIEIHGKQPDSIVQAEVGLFVPALVVHSDVWKQCCVTDGLSKGGSEAQRKAFSRAVQELERNNLVSKSGDFYWFTSGH